MVKIARLPIRRNQFKTGAFAAWLTDNGAEIGKQTNPYEVIRYRAYSAGSRKPLTHIVYAKDNGLLNFQGGSRDHYQAFMDGVDVAGLRIPMLDRHAPKTPVVNELVSQSKAAKQRAKLLARDGDECWFCGDPMGEDMTIEHLVPRSTGGDNKLANYALAHGECNHKAANKPLVQKIELRAQMRAAKAPPAHLNRVEEEAGRG
jgi:5-methylcytosine-specific restriction endonuclease McrA